MTLIKWIEISLSRPYSDSFEEPKTVFFTAFFQLAKSELYRAGDMQSCVPQALPFRRAPRGAGMCCRGTDPAKFHMF